MDWTRGLGPVPTATIATSSGISSSEPATGTGRGRPEASGSPHPGRVVKILDFRLAKLVPVVSEGEASEVATRTRRADAGTVLGTVGHVSPEQVRGRSVDHRSDIFSLGAILYEMLSGRRAFAGQSAVETMNAILKEEPSDLTALRPDLPPALDHIVRHCLEKTSIRSPDPS